MIYIFIYTPNLGFGITVFDQKREQGRFRGSIEGAGGSSEGAGGSTEGAAREHERARGSTMGQCKGAAGGSLKWLPPSRLELPLFAFNNSGRACGGSTGLVSQEAQITRKASMQRTLNHLADNPKPPKNVICRYSLGGHSTKKVSTCLIPPVSLCNCLSVLLKT